MDKPEALALLRIAINDPKGEFRGDQWEAIDQIVNERKKICSTSLHSKRNGPCVFRAANSGRAKRGDHQGSAPIC